MNIMFFSTNPTQNGLEVNTGICTRRLVTKVIVSFLGSGTLNLQKYLWQD